MRYVVHLGANMSSRAAHCVEKAAECDLAAKKTTDMEVRLLYSDLAKQWRELAFRIETLEKERDGGGGAKPQP